MSQGFIDYEIRLLWSKFFSIGQFRKKKSKVVSSSGIKNMKIWATLRKRIDLCLVFVILNRLSQLHVSLWPRQRQESSSSSSGSNRMWCEKGKRKKKRRNRRRETIGSSSQVTYMQLKLWSAFMNATKVSARGKFKQMKKIKLKTSEASNSSFT